MAIIDSIIFSNNLQKYGYRYVIEQHTDHLGRKFYYSYSCIDGSDIAGSMLNRVPLIDNMLAEAEINSALDMIEKGENVITLEFTNWGKVNLASKDRKDKFDSDILELSGKKDKLDNHPNLKDK